MEHHQLQDNKEVKLRDPSQWAAWRYRVNIILKAAGVSGIVDGSVPKPYVTKESKEKLAVWSNDDAKAQSIIVTRLAEKTISQILSCVTAKQIWDKLHAVFEQKGNLSVHLAQERFYNLKFQDQDTIVEFLGRFEEAMSALQSLGVEISQSMAITKITSALPASYNHFISAWESVPVEKHSLSELSSRLLVEEMRMKSGTSSEAFQAIRKNRKCFKCGKEGHVKSQCKDSEVIYHKMIKQICYKYGKKYTKEQRQRMYGGTDRDICVRLVKELRMPISADEFEMQLNDLSKKALPGAPLKSGAERLLNHLHDCKIPMALATNSTEQAVRLHATARPKLFGLFNHRVCASDPEIDRGKPHPDIYLVAAARFPDKPKPKQCLVFEDSATGVEAANAAGMQVVMIPLPRIDREQTRRATLVLRSMLEFEPELFGLPPFHDTPELKQNWNSQSEKQDFKDGTRNGKNENEMPKHAT